MPAFEGDDIAKMRELMDDKMREDFLAKKERKEQEINNMLEHTCAWCGKVCPSGDSYCSDDCYNRADAET